MPHQKAQQLEQAAKALHKYFDKMQNFKIKGSNGENSTYLYYNISTPSKASAKKIDRTLPTIVFCNPVLLSTYFWEAVHANQSLRRFNLVTYDLRGHGKTNGKPIGIYTRQTASNDLARLLTELSITKAFVCGVSLGSLVALQFAIDHPARCAGLMLVGVIPTPDLPEVVEGRMEITDSFLEACPSPKSKDIELLEFAVKGYLQLGFNERAHPRLERLIAVTVPWVINNFAVDHAGFRSVTVELMAKTVPITLEEYAKIDCRVGIVHYIGDVAYPVDVAHVLEQQLLEAGVKTELSLVKGHCHFGTFTDPIGFNTMLEDFLRKSVDFDQYPKPSNAFSPWADLYKDLPEFDASHHSRGSEETNSEEEDDGIEIRF